MGILRDLGYFIIDFLGLTYWDPTDDPRGQLKRRNIAFIIVLAGGLIIGAIAGMGNISSVISMAIVGGIFGAAYGFGIVNTLAFIINELRNIRNDFVNLRDYLDDIVVLIKRFFFVLIIKTIYRMFKVLGYAFFACPFIGIYQGIRLLIERKNSSYSSSGSGLKNELIEFFNDITFGRTMKERETERLSIEDDFLISYGKVIDALKSNGYEVNVFENKNDVIRSSVSLNGKRLGEIFLVAPPPSGISKQFRNIEGMVKKEFDRNYTKKFGNLPNISSSYWPENSVIGAFIDDAADNCSEKSEWLSKLENIFDENMTDE